MCINFHLIRMLKILPNCKPHSGWVSQQCIRNTFQSVFSCKSFSHSTSPKYLPHTLLNGKSLIPSSIQVLQRHSFYKQLPLCTGSLSSISSHVTSHPYHTTSAVHSPKDGTKEGFFDRIFTSKTRKNTALLNDSGVNHYLHMASNTDVMLFFKILSLPDTFFSWFLVMELQVWLLSARLGQEGKEGAVIRDSLVESLWTDVDKKMRNLGRPTLKKQKALESLLAHLQMALISYDEGLLGSDTDLAGAVWRAFIRRDASSEEDLEGEGEDIEDHAVDYSEEDLDFIIAEPRADPKSIEIIVEYIRRQIQLLDSLTSEEILYQSKATWTQPLPLETS